MSKQTQTVTIAVVKEPGEVDISASGITTHDYLNLDVIDPTGNIKSTAIGSITDSGFTSVYHPLLTGVFRVEVRAQAHGQWATIGIGFFTI